MSNTIFYLEKRRRIYTYILKNPGLHFREISRNLNIPKSTMKYHLSYLERRDLITIENINAYQRYYASQKIGETDKKFVNVLRQTVPRYIIIFLLMNENSTQTQIKNFAKEWKEHPTKIGYHLNKHHTTILFHLQKLVNLEIIEKIQNGNETRYRIKDPEYILDIFVVYKKNILGDSSDIFLYWLNNIRKSDIDRVVDFAYKVFPHPYHV